MERRVVIIGAGISGLLACKYLVEKGFDPVVFEANDRVGGLWNHTIRSTKLQNTKRSYRFSDFDWPASVQDKFPSHTEVLDYVESYAQHFNLYPCIKFRSRVTGIDYVGESFEEVQAWDLWGGTGMAFGSKGKWHVTVLDTETNATEVHQAEFVVLCIGRFSGLPNIPELPPNHCSEVFDGKVMHSMEYSDMEKSAAAELIKGKRITIVGSQKSAVDLAVECAEANGVRYPCVMIQRNPHWLVPGKGFLISHLGHFYFNRFAELLLHKPGQNFLYRFLATVLSPLRWGISKFSEIYLQWKLPLKKYGLVPRQSFLEDVSSCQIGVLPDKFYDEVEEGSILIKRSQSFRFCKEGLIVDGEDKPISSDLVILATGYKGDQKLKNIFRSSVFQKYLVSSPTSTIPIYRQVIHPRIPQLAVVGYAEGFANLPTSEIRCQWLAHFLDGNIKLPSIGAMEKDATRWEIHMKQYGGRNFWRSCIGTSNIWYNDQLCKDMNCNPRRKKGFLAEWFQPYGPTDYAGLTDQKH
ncbi:probable flavin-containing monooxygenase 1 [Rhodamnia argentea]|uniref:Flavin-containing monooxygenase n=1 Tax=Rhodamnia argentea TaxID=178133 RepID=A0A8B8QJP6_9MYRT|nr:probable flavin-containing monooxygenase 1 [Rhodamnia argentea]